jgi:hypothetical protein
VRDVAGAAKGHADDLVEGKMGRLM